MKPISLYIYVSYTYFIKAYITQVKIIQSRSFFALFEKNKVSGAYRAFVKITRLIFEQLMVTIFCSSLKGLVFIQSNSPY